MTRTLSSDGARFIITERSYDNRDNVIEVDEYQNSMATGNLINKAQSLFDANNRRYRTLRYGVDITTGAVGPALTGNKYYDPAGRVARDVPAGEAGFTATAYDAIGRVTVVS